MRDSISNAVMGKIAADTLATRMEQLDIEQRALVFAFVGLGMPLATLARELDIPQGDALAKIEDGLAALRVDKDVQLLAGMRHAGELADFHDHIRRLRLESWFCQWCRGFQVQKGRGSPRLTCSDRCRRERHLFARRYSLLGR